MQNGSPFNAFASLHVAGHILGIAPFKMKIAPKNSKTVLNIVTFRLSIFYTILYIFAFVYITVTDEIKGLVGKGYPNKFSYVEVANICAGSFTVVALLFFRFRMYNNLAIGFEYLNEIEELLKKLGCAIKYQKLKTKLTWATASQSFIYFCYLTSTAHYYFGELSAALIYVKFIPSYQIAVGRFICSRYIYLIWLNLHYLNKAIRKNVIKDIRNVSSRRANDFKAEKQIFNIKRTSKNSTDGEVLFKLDLIWKAYAKICDCGFVLGDYFSGAIFSIIFMSFMNTLFGTFQIMYIFVAIGKGYHIPYQGIVVRIVLIIGNSYNMFSIIDICTSCEKEAKETARLINDSMAFETDEKIIFKLRKMTTFMLHNYPRFSAIGFYPINHTLLFTIVGAITSYMVILYQIK